MTQPPARTSVWARTERAEAEVAALREQMARVRALCAQAVERDWSGARLAEEIARNIDPEDSNQEDN